MANPAGTNGDSEIFVPPCGHMAGIWARNDSTRGVWKAPANEVVRGALDVEIDTTKAEQGLLNPIGINCIRPFGTRGIRVICRHWQHFETIANGRLVGGDGVLIAFRYGMLRHGAGEKSLAERSHSGVVFELLLITIKD